MRSEGPKLLGEAGNEDMRREMKGDEAGRFRCQVVKFQAKSLVVILQAIGKCRRMQSRKWTLST